MIFNVLLVFAGGRVARSVALRCWGCRRRSWDFRGWLRRLFLFEINDCEENVRSLASIARLNDVSMKIAATTTVNLLKKFAGPRLPNTV